MSSVDVEMKPVEIVGYENRRVPVLDQASGEVIFRWFSVKRGVVWLEYDGHLANFRASGFLEDGKKVRDKFRAQND
ncbi:MAG: hypothetical protein VYD90_01155 [Pseudomonadota bacterium]|nr:hypothetical protein [Pseudomonadota bacterium]